MTDSAAISGTRRQVRELVDGTLEIKIHVDPHFKADFHRLFPNIDMPVAIAPLVNDFEQRPKAKPFGEQAKELKLSGFFRNPAVWRALGTDDEYRQWVQRQPSAWSGEFSEYVNGEGRCVAAHVRRAGESGTAHKAEYACIPLTDGEHRLQHQHGESALAVTGQVSESQKQSAQEWFDKMRIKYVETWAWERLRDALGVESMADANPAAVLEWAMLKGLRQYLPVSYRE